MDQPAHSIGKQHIDFLRFDHRGNFSRAIGRVGQVLSGAVGTSAIVWGAGFRAGTSGFWSGGRLERTTHSAFRAAYSGNLTALGDRRDDVAALFLTFGAEFVDAITDGISRFFRLWLFHGHEKQTRCAQKITARRAPP